MKRRHRPEGNPGHPAFPRTLPEAASRREAPATPRAPPGAADAALVEPARAAEGRRDGEEDGRGEEREVEVRVVAADGRLAVAAVLDLRPGAVLELPRTPAQPLRVEVDGAPVARGFAVDVDGQLGLEVSALDAPAIDAASARASGPSDAPGGRLGPRPPLPSPGAPTPGPGALPTGAGLDAPS